MNHLFSSYSMFYDTLYAEKDYENECNFVNRLLSKDNLGRISSILDLGCGTGGHDLPLAQLSYQVTGVDLSEGMINRAIQKAQSSGLSVTFLQGDIRSIRLANTFDAVISMFAVMGYQTGNDDFLAALQTARAHLKTGGLFIFDAWYGPAVFNQRPETRVKEFELDGSRVIRIAQPVTDALKNVVTVQYTILQLAGSQVEHEVHEYHPMRYFFAPEVEYFARQAGFKVEKICAFMEPDRLPDEHDWNVTWVLKAV